MATNLWRARALKRVLRETLKDNGVSAREAARRLGVSHTLVNDWLGADKQLPAATDVSRLLQAIDVTGDEFTRIVAMAETAGADWMIGGTPGINPQLAAALACEQDPALVSITECAPLVFPGLLQTRAYAHHIINRADPGLPEIEVQTRIMLRIARAEVITRKRDPIGFHAFIGTSAIEGGTDAPEVMAEQLEHVLDIAARDNVTLQAVDTSVLYTFAHSGAFMLYAFASNLPTVVYHEHLSSSAVLVEDVAAYESAVKILGREAMSPADTLELIADVTRRNMETK